MVSRRRQTDMPVTQPVRFYKVVALTFLFLTIALLGVIVFMSSKRADIVITTKATPVDMTSEVRIGPQEHAEVPGIVTTSIVSITQTFSPTGEKQEVGNAEGMITVKNDSPAPQPLVVKTRFLHESGVLFRLVEPITVPANGEIQALVRADKEGSEGDVKPGKFSIPGLNETRQAQVYGISTQPMSGGMRSIGVLSQKDIDVAKKQLEAALIVKAKADLASAAAMMEASLYDVSNLTVSTNAVLGTEVSAFTVSATGTAIGIFYNQATLQEWTRTQLSKRAIDENELVEPSDTAPTVSFIDYDSAKGTVNVRVFYDGIVALNPDSPQLHKDLFFGKTIDEVRRYLLALDHVHGVEVELHPAWIQTVPHINDHVTVVVKKTE